MKTIVSLGILFLIIIITSCSYSEFFYKDFNINETKTVSVGSIMIATEEGLRNDMENRMESGIRKELVYSGKEGNVIHINYREYNLTPDGAFIRDAFGQSLVYDLTESSLLRFRSLKFEILEANSNEITFKVIDFPEKPQPTQEQIDSLDNVSKDTWIR